MKKYIKKSLVLSLTIVFLFVFSVQATEDLRQRLEFIDNTLSFLMGIVEKGTIRDIPPSFQFTENISQGARGENVKYLQILLNIDSQTRVAQTGPGSTGNETEYFGSATHSAVVKFQNKYASETLHLFNLTTGTGFVGQLTRTKLNQLLQTEDTGQDSDIMKALNEIKERLENLFRRVERSWTKNGKYNGKDDNGKNGESEYESSKNGEPEEEDDDNDDNNDDNDDNDNDNDDKGITYRQETDKIPLIDLRDYFVAGNNVYRKHDYAAAVRFNFFFREEGENFWPTYNTYLNLQKPGKLLLWQKNYRSGDARTEDAKDLNCTATYGFLYLGDGDDRSVTEVGGWHNDSFQYRSSGNCPTDFSTLGYQGSTTFSLPARGIGWSLSGGISDIAPQRRFKYIFRRYPPGEYATQETLTYSTTKLTGFFHEWSPAYGRNKNGDWVANPGTVYKDVIRVVLFHGTRMVGDDPGSRCSTDPENPFSEYYLHVGGYYSYATELYMSKCSGILQHRVLWREHRPSTYHQKCRSDMPALVKKEKLKNSLEIWTNYIDW